MYLEIIFSLFVMGLTDRVFRLGVFIIVVILIVRPAWRQVQVRQTNIDVVVKIITECAEPNDLIALNPWYIGISFQRYYAGPTHRSWMQVSRICTDAPRAADRYPPSHSRNHLSP